MKNLKVVVISPGLSGAGLISDYLLNRNDFASPFNLESEFRLLHDLVAFIICIVVYMKILV